MQLRVFVSDTEDGPTWPTLFVPDFFSEEMPLNPRGFEWRYFATIDEDDTMLDFGGKERIKLDGYYVSLRSI